MAAPHRTRRQQSLRTQEAIREKIESAKLIKLLDNHADGEIELSQSRLDAAKFLLSRVISPPVPKSDDGKTPSGPVIIAWQQ